MDLEPQSAALELDDDDYGNDDFEDVDAPASTTKQQSLAVTRDDQVHPLQSTDAPSKLSFTTAVASDESTRIENDDDDDDTCSDDDDDQVASNKLSPALSLATGVECASASFDQDEDHSLGTPPPAPSSESVAVDLVSIHAHRRDDTPPLDSQQPELQTTQRLRLSAQRASVAAKRVVEYRETRARREMQEQADAAALKKKREQFRASNRRHYDAMGVNRLTGEQRFAELVKETALRKQHTKACAELERRQRWYNQRAAARVSDTSGLASARECLAPAHVALLQTRRRSECEQHHYNTVGRARRIQVQQVELHKRAVALVSKCTRVKYVRGSYMLKQESKVSKTQALARATKDHASTSGLLAGRSTHVELTRQEESRALR